MVCAVVEFDMDILLVGITQDFNSNYYLLQEKSLSLIKYFS